MDEYFYNNGMRKAFFVSMMRNVEVTEERNVEFDYIKMEDFYVEKRTNIKLGQRF